MKKSTILVVALLLTSTFALKHRSQHLSKNSNVKTKKPKKGTGHRWGYFDQYTGAWDEGKCKDNNRPSPIDIQVYYDEELDHAEPLGACMDEGFFFDWDANDKAKNNFLLNNGHSVQINGPWNSVYAQAADGEVIKYNAVQFHFHSPSEHTVNGEHYPLEMHIVHKIDVKQANKEHYDAVAVFAIFFANDEEDTPSSLFDPINGGIDVLKSCKKDVCGPADVQDVSAAIHDFLDDKLEVASLFHYEGSFTTPPCSDIASWFIVSNPQPISAAQIANFQSLWSHNPEFAENKDHSGDIGNNRYTQIPSDGSFQHVFEIYDCSE